MVPSRGWVKEWLTKREKLESKIDFDKCFSDESQQVIRIGLCQLPSGSILVRDPFNYLERRGEQPYFVTAPVGKYPLELALEQSEFGESVCTAARIVLNYRPAVRFEEALIGIEEIAEFDGGYFGFFSDSGWACVCDELIHSSFCDFADRWRQENLGRDFYQSHFGGLSDELYINWNIPGTRYTIPMFRTGLGEGRYPVYWGTDEEGRVCRLVIWFGKTDEELSQQDEEDSCNIAEEDMPEDMIWYDGYYEGEIRLREWESFFDMEERIPLMIYAQELSDEQVLESCERLLEIQYRLLDVMMELLLDRYPMMQLEYGHTMSENNSDMPNVAEVNDFSRLITPQRLVYDPMENTVAAAFGCSWDREEGLGIKIKDEMPVEIGSAAIVPNFHQEDAE